MEVLCKSDYQDIYRIKDGVLLVINKFRPIEIDGVSFIYISNTGRKYAKRFCKGCQSSLKVLTKEFVHEKTCYEPEWSLPVGTVLYYDKPVEIVGENEWSYQIKTTGDLFKGSAEEISDYLYTIKSIIDKKDIVDNSKIREICIKKCGLGVEKPNGKIECTNTISCGFGLLNEPTC